MVTVIVCSIVLVINLVLWIVVFRVLKKDFSPDGTLAEVKDEIDKLIVEINKETDRDITLIEVKCNEIRSLIDDVDKKILLYNDTLIKKENEQKIIAQLAEFQNANTMKSTRRAAKAYSQAKKTQKSDENYLPLFADSSSPPPHQSEVVATNSNPTETSFNKNYSDATSEIKVTKTEHEIKPRVDIHTEILRLAKQGFSPEMIASKLNIPISQVEITTSLFM